MLKQLQSSGIGGRLAREDPQKIKSDPWHLEDLDDKHQVIHDMDYQHLSEEDLDDTEIMMLLDPNVDDNVPDQHMQDHALAPWSAFKKTVEDCLACKECSASDECNNTELKISKNDVVAASKTNISCVEQKTKMCQNMQHTCHSYQVNPEMVNNHHGLTSDKKKIANKERAMWCSENVRSILAGITLGMGCSDVSKYLSFLGLYGSRNKKALIKLELEVGRVLRDVSKKNI